VSAAARVAQVVKGANGMIENVLFVAGGVLLSAVSFWCGLQVERRHAAEVFRARDGMDPYPAEKAHDNGPVEEVR